MTAPKKAVKARRMPLVTDLIWLENAHFCPEDYLTVLLCWDLPSGPVYRTGLWHGQKGRYVGSGEVEFLTQPDYHADLGLEKTIFNVTRG